MGRRAEGGIWFRSRKVAGGTAVAAAAVRWHPAIEYAMQTVADYIWDTLGQIMTVTGAQEEGHSDGYHNGVRGDFRCRAFDLATRGLDVPDGLEDGEDFANALRAILGPNFDVVDEGDHIHIEYDPPEDWKAYR